MDALLVASRDITLDCVKRNKWIHQARTDIRDFLGKPKKPPGASNISNKPQWVPLATEDDLGPPNRCIYNAWAYVNAHKGSVVVKTYKLYSECSRNRKLQLGCKGVMHCVVRLPNGSLLDVTCEPGDSHTFNIPADWLPDVSYGELLSGALHMGGFILGHAERVNIVLSQEGEDTPTSVATSRSVEGVKCRLIRDLPPQPWNGILLDGDEKGISCMANKLKVKVATVERWIEEAKKFRDKHSVNDGPSQ